MSLQKQIDEQARSIDAFHDELWKWQNRLLEAEKEISAKDKRIQELNMEIKALQDEVKLKETIIRIVDEK